MRFLTLFSVALLAGCQSLSPQPGDTASPYLLPTAGAQVVLNEFAPIPEGTAGVWAQNGKWIDKESGVDHYYPFCRFEVDELVGRDEGIKPGVFEVVSTQRARQISGFMPYQRYAQIIDESSEGISYVHIEHVMTLRSADQPGVRYLRCGSWERPSEADGVSIDEIRHLAGGLFSLNLE